MIRLLDILFSGVAIFAFSPLFILVILILKCTGEGEVFFYQSRVGLSGKKFKLIKFATMLKDSPNLGTGTITVKNDPRILPLGAVLRKTKINELPQLVNIFLGDMSVIGPRPLTNQTFETYSVTVQGLLKSVKPGLSGIGSVVFRNEENLLAAPGISVEFYENIISPYKGSLEEWYVYKKSIFLYFALIFVTIWVVIFPKSKIVNKLFGDLPEPPVELISHLGWD